MIPKKIHYCWFGRGEKPKLAKKCIASWQKYCPDYEIIEWNEDNFDINLNAYTKWCYDNRKYAFLSDYVRLLVVYENGGIYFDTDVELIKNLDFLLDNEAFFGFETGASNPKNTSINSGLAYGSVANGLALQSMLKEYDQLLDGRHGVVMCPELNTIALEKLGLKRDGSYQEFVWGTVYPKEYFNPYESTTGRLNKTKNTVSIHWYMGSCLSGYQKMRSTISRPLHRIFGVDFTKCFRK
ncbi:Capsular polysaccharide synthesis protein [Clostridiales bacterium CHKCI001]|nr:Capsular polysaccharide synthesis protein [Clostridiales bacterium CHKCI001]